MINRHGLTLIELLLALGLLTLIVSAIAAWMQIAGRTSQQASAAGRTMSAMNAVLELIHDDLTTGDFVSAALGGTSSEPTPPRAEVKERSLQIITRSSGGGESGPQVHVYRMDSISKTLELTEKSPDRPDRSRVLLRGIDQFQCDLDQDRSILRVSIASADQHVLTRRFAVP